MKKNKKKVSSFFIPCVYGAKTKIEGIMNRKQLIIENKQIIARKSGFKGLRKI